VTPGATVAPPTASAPAAIRPATRMASITSGVCTQGSVLRAGAALPTYSGRGMCAGTGRIGATVPGVSSVRVGMGPV
jgi:hypothetical protein